MMKKNIKKYLSYVLGIVLAMGLGLSYAYAVGANDSNAFVTKTEWQVKVAQLETSLDNVNKTIKDTNMDFVMNRPRLQVNLFEGLQNCAFPTRDSRLYFSPSGYHSTSFSSIENQYPKWNGLYLADQWNGKQKVVNSYWPTGDTSYETESFCCRYALATTTPGYYIIVSVFYRSAHTFHYVKLGKYPFESSISAKNLQVKFKKSEWGSIHNNSQVSVYGRSNSNINSGNVYPQNTYYINWTSGAADGYTGTNAYTSRVDDGEYWTQTFEFPSGSWAMKCVGSSSPYHLFPLDMTTRKFGTLYDICNVSPTDQWGEVAKVYSPAKGCYCLKSYINGEVPILNE